jgi:hypothetical protein
MSELSESQRDLFIFGGICFVIGVYSIYAYRDLKGGFFFCGIGIVFMASSNKKWAKQVWESFFGFFRALFKKITKDS